MCVHICELFFAVMFLLRAGLCGSVASVVGLTDEGTPGISEQWDINWKTAHFVSAVSKAKCHRKLQGDIFQRWM